jgi:ElaB/YqjD/DUF883 family membrane-anchored ribosome-binding protein
MENKIPNTAESSMNRGEKAATGFADTVSSAASQAGKSLGNFSQVAGERILDASPRLTSVAGDAYDASRTRVQENPVAGVAVAAAVGFMFGALVATALQRKD